MTIETHQAKIASSAVDPNGDYDTLVDRSADGGKWYAKIIKTGYLLSSGDGGTEAKAIISALVNLSNAKKQETM